MKCRPYSQHGNSKAACWKYFGSLCDSDESLRRRQGVLFPLSWDGAGTWRQGTFVNGYQLYRNYIQRILETEWTSWVVPTAVWRICCTCLLLPRRFRSSVCSHQQESWRTVRDQVYLQTACAVCASFMITLNLHSGAYAIGHWYKLDETGNCVDAFIIVYFLFIYAVVVFICDCV